MTQSTFIHFTLIDINTTYHLVIDVSKPNIIASSKVLGSTNTFVILKDRQKWLEVSIDENSLAALISQLRSTIKLTLLSGRPSQVIHVNYAVTLIRPR